MIIHIRTASGTIEIETDNIASIERIPPKTKQAVNDPPLTEDDMMWHIIVHAKHGDPLIMAFPSDAGHLCDDLESFIRRNWKISKLKNRYNELRVHIIVVTGVTIIVALDTLKVIRLEPIVGFLLSFGSLGLAIWILHKSRTK